MDRNEWTKKLLATAPANFTMKFPGRAEHAVIFAAGELDWRIFWVGLDNPHSGFLAARVHAGVG